MNEIILTHQGQPVPVRIKPRSGESRAALRKVERRFLKLQRGLRARYSDAVNASERGAMNDELGEQLAEYNEQILESNDDFVFAQVQAICYAPKEEHRELLESDVIGGPFWRLQDLDICFEAVSRFQRPLGRAGIADRADEAAQPDLEGTSAQ